MAVRDLVNRLPGGTGPSVLSDETMAAICCALHEVTSKNMENAKALADSGGIEKLVNITKGRGDRSSLKVVKAAAQVLNTLWQYRDLRSIYKKDGWNQNHFITPVSTLERDRFKSHPYLSITNQQMSPVIQSVGSTSSSPVLLGVRDPRSEYDRTQPPMQYYSSQGDATHRGLYEDPYFDDRVHFPASTDYSTQYGLKSTTNYVDFYSTKRPSYRAEQYPGSPDSWVQSIQFMEFSEVENQDDYYSMDAGYIHTQDHQGVYVMYDEALSDLKDLETELLLVASHYIEREKGHKEGSKSHIDKDWGWTHAGVDRFAVLYDMWTWEAAHLESKRQLLDSYFEAYQHALDPEERFALAQVITDIMHRCPRFDFSHPYFIKAYREECTCLRLHLQLVRGILNQHIECQREYVQRLWQKGHPDASNTFGLPLNIICKQLISINNSCSALKNIYLLEFHPSLGLASCIPRALEHLLREARHTCRPTSASAFTLLERRVLQLALDVWLTPAKPESWYSAQLQKDLFSAKVMGDPFLVGETGLLALKSAADQGQNQGQDSQMLLLEMFSKLLELLTLRHRLIEMSLESAHLARLYKDLACEMGFEEFHLYLRPVHFESASHKDKVVDPPPVFITSLLEDSDCVDRYSPATLVLAISEVDDNQIGKFSFYTKEAILKLLCHSGVENMQVTLACQATQKNALMVAVQQASFYHTPCGSCPAVVKEISSDLRNHNGVGPTRRRNSRIVNGIEGMLLAPIPKVPDALTHPSKRFQATKRAPEAFVSIQLEKVGLRDMMLNAFLLRKQAMADRMKNLDEIGKVKRDVIVEYCQKFNRHMSHYALRGQIIAYCNSLRALLDDFPTIRDTFFMVGQRQEKKGLRDSDDGLKNDPRCGIFF
ncbi:uncharacterized protein LOC133048187 [Dama dama]|uniref:uncharacterized protein LOC133048187 n=1 Tax=Dama dama TaxID=30532 RepID=UPI002A3604BF|nr:uncharacterized protein LOC133048187 [Dama dama]